MGYDKKTEANHGKAKHGQKKYRFRWTSGIFGEVSQG